nr:RNA-directed DNA polymerase, eukaryota, reverse transcriptase zinc-binding domain protein [Tanacetum cinerariifolium]
MGSGKSYVNVIKASNMAGHMNTPAIVLDEECVNLIDLLNSLMGSVKEFSSLTNLKMTLLNEGFVDLTVRYLGELWVLLEFSSSKTKEAFRDNVGVGSWFLELRKASLDIHPDRRIVWVEVEGISLKLWTKNTFRRIAKKWGDLIDVGDMNENCLHSKRICLFTKSPSNIFETFKIIFQGKVFWIRAKEVPGWVFKLLEESEYEEQSVDGSMEDVNKWAEKDKSDDPFGLYSLLNKNAKVKKDKFHSPIYPLGFTPDNEVNTKCDMGENFINGNVDEEIRVDEGVSDNMKCKGDKVESMSTRRFKKSKAPRSVGSFLNLMEEVVKVGQTMGYNMGECNSVGNSGGILCVWDPNAFRKTNHTILDYFVIIRGVWIKSCFDLLIIAVYAPHDSRDKQMLWDYLVYVINQWHGEAIIMGDFNEVRYKSNKFGSNFNAQGAGAFNSFIANAGLEELPLGGSAFTWCHKCERKVLFDNLKEELWLVDEAIDKERRAIIEMCYPRSLSSEQREEIEREVSKEELKTAVWDCGTDKSSGSDGYTFGFYRKFWSIIENDVYAAVKHFFNHGDIPAGCNASFIALIPKIPDAILVQSAFIARRQILDGPFILNEVLHWCNKKKKKSLIFKVDFKKAYDSVRWDFLDDVLKKFGFGNKWCNWIQCCLKSSRGSILVNGSPTDEFQFFKGLRINMSKSKIMGVHVENAVPSRVLHVLESISGNFFNGHEMGSNKATWLKWNYVLKDKKYRGLGVYSLYALNRGLMIKWVWRFFTQKESLWAKVITAIHGDYDKVESRCHTVGRSCWLPIVNEVWILKNKGMNLKLGNGDTSRFWTDRWWIWNLESSREFSVASAHKKINEIRFPIVKDATRWVKCVPIKVNILAWKIRNVALPTRINILRRDRLSHRLNLSSRGLDSPTISCSSCNGNVESADHVFFECDLVKEIWCLVRKCARRLIDSKLLPSIPTPTVWDKFLPRKVNIFLWRLSLDSLPHRLNLSSRGLDIPTISCSSCNGNVESVDYVFFECDLVKEIWCLVRKWCDISIPTFASYDTWNSWFSTWQATKAKSCRLYVIFAALFWWIWRYRNSVTFSSDSIKKGDLFDNICASSFSWISNRGHAPCNCVEWLKNPLLITGS